MASDLPSPPRRQRGSRPRRPRVERTLSREAIIDAALRVVDVEGADAVTMRRVAQELDTGAASLYAHIDGKDELLDLVLDKVIGEVAFGEAPDPKRWRQQIKAYLTAYHDMLLSHRDLAKVGLGRIPLGPNGIRSMEQALAIMKAGKLSDKVIAFGADLLAQYVTASAYETSLFLERNTGDDGDFLDWHDELEKFFTALPRDQFPTIVGMAPALVGESGETDGQLRFEFGLDVLITGLATVKL